MSEERGFGPYDSGAHRRLLVTETATGTSCASLRIVSGYRGHRIVVRSDGTDMSGKTGCGPRIVPRPRVEATRNIKLHKALVQ